MKESEINDSRRKIFIVDDNATNLLIGRKLLKPFYDVYPANSAAMLFAMLENVFPDLILLDIEMPLMDGYATLCKLKEDERFKEIPVIFLTVKDDEGSELMGFDLGAVDYVSKPFSPALLQKRIENQLLILEQKETIRKHASDLGILVRKKTHEIFKLQNAVLSTVADLVEFRDSFTGGHIMRTQLFMEALITGLLEQNVYTDKIIGWNLDFILPSMPLHDIGKIGISDKILNKPAKLSETEYETIKTHVEVGVEAVKRIIKNSSDHAFLRHAINIISTHHEKWDGSGYPLGLKGEEIPLEGRLAAIVDVYDALVSWRPYKKAHDHEYAVEIITEGSGKHFDPLLVDVFLIVQDKFEQIHKLNKDCPD